MSLFELLFIIMLWAVLRGIGRVLKQGAPNVRRAATTLRQQLEKQVQEYTGNASPQPQEPAAPPNQLDQQTAMTIDGAPPAWEAWKPLEEEPHWHWQGATTFGENELTETRPAPVYRRPDTAATPTDAQKPLLPQFGGDALVQAVVFSEVLGPPKSRKNLRRPTTGNHQH